MFHSIALIGRPNVGKSTIFNALTGERNAIVADFAGLTRDRQYGYATINDNKYLLIDTPGIGVEDELIDEICTKQTMAAIEEADLVLLVVDARVGLLPNEQEIAHQLRSTGKNVMLIINKIDGLNEDLVESEFYELGFELMVKTAASHRRGMQNLKDLITKNFKDSPTIAEIEEDLKKSDKTTVCIVGRPNVGKSTLVNRLLGEERVVACDLPGTTRDSIAIDFEFEDEPYRLIDTAGIRRRSRVEKGVETFSVVKSIQTLEYSDVAFVLIDCQEDVVDQDLHLLELASKTGVAIIIVLNKWDNLDEDQRKHIKNKIQMKLNFMDFAPMHFISALHGTGVGLLFRTVKKIKQNLYQEYSTNRLTQILEQAMHNYPPPLKGGRRIKLRHAHLGGHKPLSIIIHGNQTDSLSQTYQRYLTNQYRKALGGLEGVPLRLVFKTGDNPYKDRKNKLTQRQLNKRRRMMKHVKKKK